ncbi:MAG TPA: Gfo/Idh/MocA family oxidoreductase [Gemmataceae bacterium]|jgi:glucose-fructose oxidoreductase|nr:Gfo/Idh/MocA family oxidoreductase [Gemmataceae bacterium]
MFGNSKKIRYAVVGAGWFGQSAVLPAFANAREHSALAALVSGDVQKRATLSSDYSVPAYSYEQYEDLLRSGSIDAVYIVSPNSIHKDHALAAARHGIHVLCEKPLADSAVAAEEIVAACDRAGVLLMTAYRLHFEKGNLQAIDLIRKGTIGEARAMMSAFTQQVDPDNSRLDAKLGGHPLLDVGVYCINAARYLFRAEPVEVTAFAATANDPRFHDVPEMVSAVMRFPEERLASFTCGFGEAKTSSYQVIGTKGDLCMDPAFSHVGERVMTVTVDGKSKKTEFGESDQIAAEIVYFSECVQKGRRPEPDGREALIDLWIIEAIKSSILKGMAVPLQPVPEKPRPDKAQHISKPKKPEPELVRANAPQAT